MTKEAINCHHNYVSRETHFGENLLITRKGAIRAGLDELGIIPGSMGARSYIVKGKANPESFCSCSHGAGRKMSRSKAKFLLISKILLNKPKVLNAVKTVALSMKFQAPIKTLMKSWRISQTSLKSFTHLNKFYVLKVKT